MMDTEGSRSESLASSSGTAHDNWQVCGRRVSRSALVFGCQIIILYIAIITCFINLTINNGPNELWISLLSLCLGSILPSPKVRKPHSSSSSSSSSSHFSPA